MPQPCPVARSVVNSVSTLLNGLHARPLRAMAGAVLLAVTAGAFLVHAALVRGSRAEAFRVAITVGEGHLTVLPTPGGNDAPAMIAEPGPLYTDPMLMRTGAQVLPRVTLPVHVRGPKAEDLAILHGLERSDPQATLLAPRHLTGSWAEAGSAQVVLGADLAETVGATPGGVLALQLDRPGSKPVPAQVVGIVRTGREEWDAHGLWSDLPLARTVRGIQRPQDSEAVTHLAIYLPDPASSGNWREGTLAKALPEFTELREWWQLDLEPLRYAPQADPGVPWATALLALLVAGLLANLLLGPAPVPRVPKGWVPQERALRLRVLGAIGLQALVLAAFAMVAAVALVLTTRNGIAIAGSGPLVPRMFLPPGAIRLGALLPAQIIPAWSLRDAWVMGVALLVCTPLAASVRLWRIGNAPQR